MAIKTPEIKWFEGLSPIVKCSNCIYWKRDPSALWNTDPCTGQCDARDE